jgi:hypothetical protein
MTPEQLEEIPGIGPKLVERIQLAVNSYYQQFEEVLESETGGEAAAPAAEEEAVAPSAETVAEPPEPEPKAPAGEAPETGLPGGFDKIEGSE